MHLRNLNLLLCCHVAALAASVTTAQYDNQRTGANTSEVLLNQTNVAARFGLLGSYTVSGNVWTQPLVTDPVSVGGILKRLCIVATATNNIYAFDAGVPGSAAIWTVNLGAGATSGDFVNLYGSEGVLGTPVIDTSTNVMYFTSLNSSRVRKLYALKIADGSTFAAATTIGGTVGGVTFDSTVQLARPGILLTAGNVYIGLGSYADFHAASYHGWIFSYDKSTLSNTGIWLSTLAGAEGAVWMSGGGPALDAQGNLYVTTGNGTCNSATGDYGSSFVKLSTALAVLDFMMPSNCSTMSSTDQELGSGRAIVFGNFVTAGGKDGRWWLVNKNSMSGGPVQVWQITTITVDALYSGVCFANNTLFVAPGASSPTDFVSSYSFNGSTFNQTPVASTSGSFRFVSLAYTSNGSTSGTDILWAMTADADADTTAVVATLRAYNATTMTQLYSSGTLAADAVGLLSKFAEPTIVNGKVYVSTLSNKVQVYGLLPQSVIGGKSTISGTGAIQ